MVKPIAQDGPHDLQGPDDVAFTTPTMEVPCWVISSYDAALSALLRIGFDRAGYLGRMGLGHLDRDSWDFASAE